MSKYTRILFIVVVLVAPAARAATVVPPDPSASLSRIAFGSCAFQSVPQPIFRAVVRSRPDLYLSLGDAIYGDYDLETKQAYEVTPDTLRRELGGYWRTTRIGSTWWKTCR